MLLKAILHRVGIELAAGRAQLKAQQQVSCIVARRAKTAGTLEEASLTAVQAMGFPFAKSIPADFLTVVSTLPQQLFVHYL